MMPLLKQMDMPIQWLQSNMPSLGRFLDRMGTLVIYLIQSFECIIKGRVNWKHTFYQISAIGADSTLMSLIICVIAGSVLALQSAEKFAQTGADAYVGGLVAVAIVREIGPIFACLAVSARSGTAIASELANMKVTNQVDALKIMHINPIRYLMVPRLIACVVSLPMLTMISQVCAILGGCVVAFLVSGLHYSKYLESVWLNLAPYDIEISMVKAAIFGMMLASISCTVGLTTEGGAKDVGLSTTKSAVATCLAIVVMDFFLTWIFFGTTYERDF